VLKRRTGNGIISRPCQSIEPKEKEKLTFEIILF
jgi:hypothetical protein